MTFQLQVGLGTKKLRIPKLNIFAFQQNVFSYAEKFFHMPHLACLFMHLFGAQATDTISTCPKVSLALKGNYALATFLRVSFKR